MKLYVNGVFARMGKGIRANSVSFDFTKLVLGRDEELSPSIIENYDIHIDDFAVWFKALSDEEIAYVMTQSKKSEKTISIVFH